MVTIIISSSLDLKSKSFEVEVKGVVGRVANTENTPILKQHRSIATTIKENEACQFYPKLNSIVGRLLRPPENVQFTRPCRQGQAMMANLFRTLLSSSVASHYGKGNPDQAMECERVAVDFVIPVGLLLKVDTIGSFRRSYRLGTLSP